MRPGGLDARRPGQQIELAEDAVPECAVKRGLGHNPWQWKPTGFIRFLNLGGEQFVKEKNAENERVS